MHRCFSTAPVSAGMPDRDDLLVGTSRSGGRAADLKGAIVKYNKAFRGLGERSMGKAMNGHKKTTETGRHGHRTGPLAAKLDQMIEEAVVDAYGESEQVASFYSMLDDNLGVPFQTEVLGLAVTVERIDITADGQIVAVCSRGKSRQRIPILDLPLPTPRPAGAEWIDAFRRWARGR